MVEQAKSFRELETLALTLDRIESVWGLYYLMQEANDVEEIKNFKRALSQSLPTTKLCADPLLNGWLTTSLQDQPEFAKLRETYLPETILAWIATLQMAGPIFRSIGALLKNGKNARACECSRLIKQRTSRHVKQEQEKHDIEK
ncbi:hypothetical protein BofuT4_P081260.1 [Botrytis cinerea T4]|uniref:Nuclear pore complex protein n=1 Tax=Botryotinia fuckeliana (strain T4) TaxID=999810 RepID=G2YL33_BOTF4|nr:hypothetical protein BofuT4_P081260.1 [Botrytis cinerea T4]